MDLKEKIQETAEKLYDLVKDGRYDVEINLMNKEQEKNGVKIKSHRSTAHNIKWRSRNR